MSIRSMLSIIFLDLDSGIGQLTNLVPIDRVLDYMILGYFRAKRIYLYLNGQRSSRVQLSVETKEVTRANLRAMIRLA
jgi:hypothetical protein